MSDTVQRTWEDAIRWLLAQPDQRSLVEACYYDTPLTAAAERYRTSEEWQAVRQYIPAVATRALDLGAGNGITAYAIACDGWQVDAVEPDPSDMVGAGAIRALAAATNSAIAVVEQWGESLPFADDRFDLVVARQVLHHARSLPTLCREIHRVLKPGGVLIALRDHVVSDAAQLASFLANHPLHRLYGGENAYTVAQYKRALRDSGLLITCALGPFDSVINYAPLTEASIRADLARRLARVPIAANLVRRIGFGALRRVLTGIDRRPGRLWSFVCSKGHIA